MSSSMDTSNEQDDVYFARLWEEARAQFKKQTKLDIRPGHEKTLDEVMRELEKAFNRDGKEKENPKKEKAKELAYGIMNFINLLGGLVAQGASVVFGPATMCFNALQFLISIPKKIEKFYENLAELFEEVLNLMKQFKIYSRIEHFARMEELKDGAHKLMICFVDTCALSLNTFTDSWTKNLTNHAKLILFDNDSGVKGQLEVLRRLIQRQSQISDAVSLEHILKTEKNTKELGKMLGEKSGEMLEKLRLLQEKQNSDSTRLARDMQATKDVVLAGETRRRNEEERDNHFKRVTSTLCDEKLAIKQRETFDQIHMSNVPGTGEWLNQMEVFETWKTSRSQESSILLIIGEAGSGASHLMASIKRMLEMSERNGPRNSSVSHVACYAFERQTKKTVSSAETSNQSEVPVLEAMKCIIVQLAKVDKNYCKDLYDDFNSEPRSFSNPEELARVCLPLKSTAISRDFTYYLLFDNVSHLEGKDAKSLLKTLAALQSPRIRVVVTASKEFSRKSLESFSQAPTISIEGSNLPDIERYIDHQLKNDSRFEGERTNVKNVVTAIKTRLPALSSGNFRNVDTVLDAIKDAMRQLASEEDIIALIDTTTLEQAKDAPAKLIQQLNESLNGQQIEEVNELLTWVIHGRFPWTISELRAALLLKTQTEPWESLQKRLEDQYKELFQIDFEGLRLEEADDALVSVKESEVAQYLIGNPRASIGAKVKGKESRFTMEIKIENATLPQIQRFVWDLNEKTNLPLEKFPFENPEKGSAMKPKITANPVDCHIILARRCFDILFEDENSKIEDLRPFILGSVLYHLREMRYASEAKSDPEEQLSSEEKREMGRKMVNLLNNFEILEKNLSYSFLWHGDWLDSKTEEHIHLWLQDAVAMEGVDPKDRGWVRGLASKSRAAPFKSIMQVVARKWLCDRNFEAVDLFNWIDKFIEFESSHRATQASDVEKQEQPESKQPELTEEGEEEQKPVEERIERALEWAEDKAGCQKEDPIYQERLGDTYLDVGKPQLAKEALLKAKTLAEDQLSVLRLLITAESRCGETENALKESKLLISKQRESFEKVPDDVTTFSTDLVVAATLHVELDHLDEAELKLREALKIEPLNYIAHRLLLNLLVNNDRKTEAVAHLQEMSSAPEETVNSRHTRLGALFVDSAILDTRHITFEVIFHVCGEDAPFQDAFDTLETTLVVMENEDKKAEEIALLLWKGLVLARYSKEANSLASAIKTMEKCLDLGANNYGYNTRDITVEAAEYLATYRADLLIASQFDPTMVKEFEEKFKQMMSKIKSKFPRAAEKLGIVLGGLYSLASQAELSQKFLTAEMNVALNYLSDDDKSNDYWGFRGMGRVLGHAGDDLNALSAWSLHGPTDRDDVREKTLGRRSAVNGETLQGPEPKLESAEGNQEGESRPGQPSWFYCDGRCGKIWRFADDFYECKICADVQFCPACLEKLKSGTLRRSVCGPGHAFLHVPPWSDEDYLDVGPGNVRVGGELVDGKRVGGKVIPIDDWIDTIRAGWGIEKPKETAVDDGNTADQ